MRKNNQESEDDIREKLDELTEKCLAVQREFNMIFHHSKFKWLQFLHHHTMTKLFYNLKELAI